jgi:Domain of unknown function (DUF4158)
MFSADELAQLPGFPEIGRAGLSRFFMLTPADEEFARRFRDRPNVLGAAVQLCTLPWLGPRSSPTGNGRSCRPEVRRSLPACFTAITR